MHDAALTSPPPDLGAIAVRNPMRVIVPIATAGLIVLMFLPPLLFADLGSGSGWKIAGGVGFFAACLAWLARSAVRSPWSMMVGDRLVVRRLLRATSYERSRVTKWWFAVPDGLPTRVPPATNGVLYVTLDDGTRFRGEVTAEEAGRVAAILPALAS